MSEQDDIYKRWKMVKPTLSQGGESEINKFAFEMKPSTVEEMEAMGESRRRRGHTPPIERARLANELDLIELLRDCVVATWGNTSFNETQKLFDKFLKQRGFKND